MVLIVSSKCLYSLTKSSHELSTRKVHAFPVSSVVSAVCGPKGIIYFVAEDQPRTIVQWNTHNETHGEFVKLPVAIRALTYYRNKLYGTPVEGTCLVCVDPLNRSVEKLDTHHEIACCEPADHGFVFKSIEGLLFGFHFNYGSCKVANTNNALLLGHYKRYSVALALNDDSVFGVNESGQVVHPPTIPPRLGGGTFVCSGDDIFVYKRAEQCIETVDGTVSCHLPPELVKEHVVGFAAEPTQEDEDVCTLCFCEFEGEGDGITLDCGHRFHKDCVLEWVGRWDEFKAKGNHIAFTNAVCPGGCKYLVRHPLLGPVSESICTMFQRVSRQAKKVLEDMPATKLDEDLLFYVCHKCGNPFYGGEKVCFRAQGGEPTKNPADLVCDKCQTDFICPKHAREFVVYKCSYCCNPATERSFGNRYLCERCSARWTATTEPEPFPCPGTSQCPLGANGHAEGAYPIGCLACLPDSALAWDKVVAPLTKGDPATQL